MDNASHAPAVVYIAENDIDQPYIVVDCQSGKCCLLRQNLLDQDMIFNDREGYFSYYPNSAVDRYLNGPFLDRFEASVRAGIIQSQITVVSDSSIGVSGDETETILRQVFLPSRMEITGYSTQVSPPEGSPFPFLNEGQTAARHREGEQSAWWLRSPDTSYSNVLFIITGDGSTNCASTTGISGETALGIRPAFWVPESMITTDQNGDCYVR